MPADIKDQHTFAVLELHKRQFLLYVRAEGKATFSVFVDEHNSDYYSLSGCWPSWAGHAHSVIFISEKSAVKDDSSGEQT